MMRLKTATLVCVLGLSALLVAPGCSGPSDDDDDDGPQCTPVTATWSNLEANIFSLQCALSSCHSTITEAGNLILTVNSGYDQMVNVTSFGTFNGAQMPIVDPGNSAGSFLYIKLTTPGGGAMSGLQMPEGNLPLCEEKLDAIAEWIDAGALEN